MKPITLPKNKGLKNPAVAAVASSPEGKEAIGNAIKRAQRQQDVAIEVAGKIIPFMFKVGVACIAGYVVYRIYNKRFVKLGENNSLNPANISEGQAANKAETIYQAMYGWGADVEEVAGQLAGLNYNGWVRLYNAFGNREPFGVFGDKMNLVEWLNDQFDADEMAELRFVLPGVF